MKPLVIAIGGGKGGTGKSVLTTQIGIVLAQRNFRVILVDADLEGGNLHTFFGLEEPSITIDWLLNNLGEPRRAVLPTGQNYLGLIAALQKEMFPDPEWEEIDALNTQLRSIQADFILIDVGSGSSYWSTLLFESADIGLLITEPEPHAIEKEYRFLRHVYRWRLANIENEQSFPSQGWLPVPWLTAIARHDKNKALMIQEQLRKAPLLLLINKVCKPEERNLGEDMMAVLRRFFGIKGEAIGWLEEDDRVWFSARNRRPLMLQFPDSLWAENLQNIVNNFILFIEAEGLK